MLANPGQGEDDNLRMYAFIVTLLITLKTSQK